MMLVRDFSGDTVGWFFPGPMSPVRHLEGARLLSKDVSHRARADDAGDILADVVRGYMSKMKIPDGIR